MNTHMKPAFTGTLPTRSPPTHQHTHAHTHTPTHPPTHTHTDSQTHQHGSRRNNHKVRDKVRRHLWQRTPSPSLTLHVIEFHLNSICLHQRLFTASQNIRWRNLFLIPIATDGQTTCFYRWSDKLLTHGIPLCPVWSCVPPVVLTRE